VKGKISEHGYDNIRAVNIHLLDDFIVTKVRETLSDSHLLRKTFKWKVLEDIDANILVGDIDDKSKGYTVKEGKDKLEGAITMTGTSSSIREMGPCFISPPA